MSKTKPTQEYAINDLESDLDELFSRVEAYRRSSRFLELLAFATNFKRYAPFNVMLIGLQKPGAKYVLTATAWRQNYGRVPKKDARPLIALRPNGPIMFLYDVSDTVEIPGGAGVLRYARFPAELASPFDCRGNSLEHGAYQRLTENLCYHGIVLRSIDTGACLGGQLDALATSLPEENFEIAVSVPVGGATRVVADRARYAMSISTSLRSNESRFAVIVHELAHFFLHHLECRYKPGWGDRRGMAHSAEEFEAEAVACIVCQRQGIDTESQNYLARYCLGNDLIPPVNVLRMFQAVTSIEKMFSRDMSFRDGFLYLYDQEFRQKCEDLFARKNEKHNAN